jgi:hypothetical protein
MESITGRVATVFAVGMLATMIPASVMAAHAPRHAHPAKHGHVAHAGLIFGSLTGYTAGTSAQITTAGAVPPVKISLTAKTKVTANSATGGAITTGDQVAAVVHLRKGALVASAVRFDTQPFAVSRLHRFEGLFASIATTPPPATLSITLHNNKPMTFNWDATTKFFPKHKGVAPTPKTGDRLHVWAREYTDSSWFAKMVRVIAPKKTHTH